MNGILSDYWETVQDDPQYQALKGVYGGAYNAAKDFASTAWGNMHLMDKFALMSAPVPVLGDVMGAAADARMYAQEPESRTWGNAGLSALGLIPFIPNAGMVKAFHGTPHKVDKFSLDKIGTGEGAQAYGHGLYFAENPETAKSYLRLAGPEKTIIGGKNINDLGLSDEAKGLVDQSTFKAQVGHSSIEDEINMLRKESLSGRRDADAFREAADALSAGQVERGNLYSVKLNVEPEDLLDWDAPFSKQSKAVKEKLRASGIYKGYKENLSDFSSPMMSRGNKARGENLMMYLEHKYGNQEAVSKALKEAGIPGIKYLDGNSRSAGKGTRNFVIFDDNLIDIEK